MPRTPVNSQQGSTGSNSSGGSRSTQTSGYQSESQTGYATDDGSFESQILRRATKERPANLRMTAIRDYAPCCNEELSVRKGQRVRVLYRNHDWVFAVTKHGSNGFLPYSYVRPSRKYSTSQERRVWVYTGKGIHACDAPTSTVARHDASSVKTWLRLVATVAFLMVARLRDSKPAAIFCYEHSLSCITLSLVVLTQLTGCSMEHPSRIAVIRIIGTLLLWHVRRKHIRSCRRLWHHLTTDW